MKLIHYGSKEFVKHKFQPIENSWIKPKGGLWTSPIESNYGWKDWCKDEDFRDCNICNSFIISLKVNARIFIIDSFKDLLKLRFISEYKIDFESLCKDFDAIHLTENGQQKTRYSSPNIYGWDCESVLILNSNSIIV